MGFGRTAVVAATPGVLHKRYFYNFFSKNLSREKLDRILPIPYRVEQLTNHFASIYLHLALHGCNNATIVGALKGAFGNGMPRSDA